MFHLLRSTVFAVVTGCVMYAAFNSTSVARAEEAAAPAAPGAPAGAVRHSKTLIDLYKEGGWVMHMIALTSVATVATLTFCFTAVSKRKMVPATLVTALNDSLQSQDVSKSVQLCDATPSVLSTVIKESLQKAGTGVAEYTKADLEAAAAETIFHEETRLMLWVNMLNAFAAVAPMIGLLGTVSGMIQSFDKLSQGASKASDFAGGIGEAMVGTAGGLLVAIPSMFAYFYFKNTLQALMSDVARVASTLIGRFVSGPPAPAAA